MSKRAKKSTGKSNFYSLSVQMGTRDRLHKIHKAYEPRFTITGFIDELLDLYLKTHCPECKGSLPLTVDTCSCKSPERT
jgi:hypothetical protein